MQLDVTGHVIILDEAHNIEDICREVASVSFREDHLTAVASECESLMKQRAADSEIYGTLQTYSLKLVDFLKITVVDKVVSLLLITQEIIYTIKLHDRLIIISEYVWYIYSTSIQFSIEDIIPCYVFYYGI